MTELNEPTEKPADEQNVTPSKAMDAVLGLIILLILVALCGTLCVYISRWFPSALADEAYIIGFLGFVAGTYAVLALIGMICEWFGVKPPDPIEKPVDSKRDATLDDDRLLTTKETVGMVLAALWGVLGYASLFSGAYRALQLYSDLLAAIALLAVPLGVAAILGWLAPRRCVDRIFELKK